ncbi:hypothetical protein ACFLWO_02515 [Chloroflexota bacterium]
MTGNNELENGADPQGRQNEQVERSEAEFQKSYEVQDGCLVDYIPGSNKLADYAIKHLGAEPIGTIREMETRPPFPCLTGASNTSTSDEIDQNLYKGIVAAGIDTLELNFGIAEYKYPDMFEHLNEVKSDAASDGFTSRGEPIEWFGNEFMIQPRGSKGGYEYLLKNGDVDLQIMPNAQGGEPSPELRVVFRSSYLWQNGLIPAYNKIIYYLNEWAYITYCKVSRADLCVDKIMPLPEVNRKTQVVSRLREKDLFYGGDFQTGQLDTGYHFGKGAISCRFYDKTYEISVKGHGHIMPLWEANGWDRITPVTRLEVQLRREGLRRFDVNMDFSTFQDCKADIWEFVTGKYMRIVAPDSASRKERAKTIDYWSEYQNCAPLFGTRFGVLPFKQTSDEWRPLLKQATGCLSSAWARLAADTGAREATQILYREWGEHLPKNVIEAGLLRIASFLHMS